VTDSIPDLRREETLADLVYEQRPGARLRASSFLKAVAGRLLTAAVRRGERCGSQPSSGGRYTLRPLAGVTGGAAPVLPLAAACRR